MKKKLVSFVLSALMVVSLTTGCGGEEPVAPDSASVSTANQGAVNPGGTAGNGGAGDQATPDPALGADASQQMVVLDYDQLNEWIYSGWIGTSTSGEGVLLATSSNYDYGILIFTDDESMNAVSFLGPFETDYAEYMKISDEVNGLSITFAVTELDDGEIQLDMGEYGVATVSIRTKENVMLHVKEIIEKYTQVA